VSGERRRAVALLLACFAVGSAAQAFDPFHTERGLPATAAGRLLADPEICSFGEVGKPLPLVEAVERSLCNNPRTRQAWAGIKVQAAGVGVSRAAYLPQVTASVQGVHDESSSHVPSHPEWSSSNRALVDTESVSLSWVLYDYGGRDASVRNATELLSAAQANHDAVLQTVFASVSKDYYAAQAAQGAWVAAQEIERTASQSAQVAVERVNRGVAPISDQLQAQTALAQAGFNRARAEGDWQAALGQLAADMNLRPDASLVLPAVEQGIRPDADFERSLAELLVEAERTHPSVLVAEAQLRAAAAKAEQTHAEGLPSLSFVARTMRNGQPISPAIGQPDVPAVGHDWSVGLQLNVPLFEGFGRTYQEAQAQAQVEAQRAAVDQARSQVGLEVWTSYQALRTATQSVANSGLLLDLAQASTLATRDRYLAGVGSILEWLNAQSALATARRQRLQALADWRSARLQLAAALGQLGMWRIAGS
jgi:outer membrane protein